MKMPERKYTVIRHYTRDDFVSFGYNRWINKNIWWMDAYVVIFVVTGLLIDGNTSRNSIWQYLFTIPFVVVFILGCWKVYQYGVRFFNKVKDLPEPIDLSTIKESK